MSPFTLSTCYSVWFGNESRQTPADGVTISVRSAGGAGATGARITWISGRTLDLWSRIRNQRLWTLTEWSSLLRYAHGIPATWIWITRVRNNATLLRCWVGNHSLRTLAGWFTLLWYTHGSWSTWIGITGIPPGSRWIIRW